MNIRLTATDPEDLNTRAIELREKTKALYNLSKALENNPVSEKGDKEKSVKK